MSRLLWQSTDPILWEDALKQYDKQRNGLKNANTLTPLDIWFTKELPALLSSQKLITQPQLSELMKWKLQRGQNRPALQKFVDSLEGDLVKKISKEAFELLDKGTPIKALDRLATLKGVGPATASAILSAYSPTVPFLSDEALIAIGLPGKYTKAAFLRLLEESNQICKALNSNQKAETEWNPKTLEMALFSEEKRFKTEDSTLKRKKQEKEEKERPKKIRKVAKKREIS